MAKEKSMLSVSALARKMEKPASTTLRWVKRLHELHGGILVDVAGAKARKVAMSKLLEVCPDFAGAHVFAREDLERIDEDLDTLTAALNRQNGRIKVLESRVDELQRQVVRMTVNRVRRGRGAPLSSQQTIAFQAAG